MFARNGIDTLHGRNDSESLATRTYLEIFFLHIAGRVKHKTCYLEIGESEHLCLSEHLDRDFFNGIVATKFCLEVDNIFEFAEKPRINLCEFIYTVDCISLL